MKPPLQAISIVAVLVSLSAAQNSAAPAEIRNVNVGRSSGQTNVEVILTSPVTPNVIVATGPDRLVLELPNTTASARQRHIPVNQDGVKAVRVGLNSADPPVTRVVIDLDEARLYQVATNGNRVTLSVLPAENASGERKGAPVPAASAPIWGRLKPQKKEPGPVSTPDTSAQAAPIVPPKPFPPLQLPSRQTGDNASASTAANQRPTAAHSNYGSLQQGSVFPTSGAPGTGYVPKASEATAAAPAGSATAAVSKPAGPVTPPGVSNPGADSTVTTTVVAHLDAVTKPATNQVPANQAPVTPPPPPVVTASLSGRTYPALQQPAKPEPQVMAKVTPAVTVSSSGPAAAAAVQTAAPSPAVAVAAKAAPVASAAAVTPVGNSQAGTVASAPAPIVASGTQSTAPSVPVTVAKSEPVATAVAPTPQVQAPAQTTSAVPASAQPAAVTVATAQPLPNAPAAVAQPALTGGFQGAAAEVEAEDASFGGATRQPNSDIRMGFKVKYVAAGAAYLEGGRNAGLSEGMKLDIRDNVSGAESGSNEAYGPKIAELEILSVADSSTVAEIHEPKRDVKAGDWAYLSSEDTQSLVAQRSLSPTRKYPVVISFTEGTDPLAEEAHAEVPRPPMPDINRARGRFGFDYSGIMGRSGMGFASSSFGMSVQTDITRIGGTYWNMSGFWRGRLTSTSGGGQQTLQDLINRTYHLGMTYDNPESHFVAGFGRLFLPYATSLETIDGGYVGFRITKVTTLGVFAGSTPDPTSYSYNPQQELWGTFVNFQGGDYQAFRYSDTFGMGVEMLKWKINRPFVFGENSLSFKRFFSLYSAVQADSPAGNQAVAAPGTGLSRSFTTLRFEPHKRIEFDLNHTYFRDIPTFDPSLIGTGLLDKYLFQGFSAGTRVEVIKDIWVYTTLGKSNRSGDKSASLNQLYGFTFNHLPGTKIRADVHYSKFSSAFGSGQYEAASISRSFRDSFRWEVLAGQQSYSSSLAAADKSHFVTGNLDVPLGAHYYVQSGFTWTRGGTQNYNQMLFSFGYRFDTRNTRSK